jgi:hypothetical protein
MTPLWKKSSNYSTKTQSNAFARAIGRIRRPEVNSYTFRSGSYEAHPHADTISFCWR